MVMIKIFNDRDVYEVVGKGIFFVIVGGGGVWYRYGGNLCRDFLKG